LRSQRRSYVVASVFVLTGSGLVGAGIVGDSLPEVVAGVSLAFSGQLIACMHILRKWITNTAVDRQRYNDAAVRLDEESAKYAAGQRALEEERGRCRRDRIAAARRMDEHLRAEQAALDAQFEEQRNALVSHTFEVAYRMFKNGGMDAAPTRNSVVVQFPTQPADQERARERSRDVSP
jgi:hypothetical protein